MSKHLADRSTVHIFDENMSMAVVLQVYKQSCNLNN